MSTQMEVPMRKQQRSAQLPPDVFNLIDAYRASCGAKFNTQCLAAFLQYFFLDPSGPDPTWMRAAALVESGELEVSKVPVWIATQAHEVAARACEELREERADIGANEDTEDEFKEWCAKLEERSERLFQWERVTEIGEGSTIAGLRRVWEHLSFGLDVWSMLHAADLKKFTDLPPGKILPGDEAIVYTESEKEALDNARRDRDADAGVRKP